ncbi:hypothetical protein [Flagellimonas flava]|uniref:hypothetical protein n=1 Tax=Flagellimonas flava TaxID=570519 RepID=UPI003D6468C0
MELNYGYEDDEQLPSFANPETRLIVEKLTDHKNYEVVLNDEELGLKYRNNLSTAFFKEWKDMQDIYQARNVQDKYVYEIEMLKVWHFGLGLQLRYFKLGNEDILASSDDPNASRVVFQVNSNIDTLIDNFNIYLDEINHENAFSDDGKKLLAQGIDTYFVGLVELYPQANYQNLERKIDLLEKKSSSEHIKNSLKNLRTVILSKKSKPNQG